MLSGYFYNPMLNEQIVVLKMNTTKLGNDFEMCLKRET